MLGARRGTPDHAVTGGIGFGYSGEDVSGKPAFMIGGESRVGRRIKLITESYGFAGEKGMLIMAGLRILGERLTVDVGGMGFAGGGESACCLPVVNFSYSLGK